LTLCNVTIDNNTILSFKLRMYHRNACAIRYADAKSQSQIGYCLDLYALDDCIRRKGRPNFILLIWSAARYFGGWIPTPVSCVTQASSSGWPAAPSAVHVQYGWGLKAVLGIKVAANVLLLPWDGWKAATDAVDRLEEAITAIKAEKMIEQGGQVAAAPEMNGKESEDDANLREEMLRLGEVEELLRGLKQKAREVANRNFKLWVVGRRVKVAACDLQD
jgi:hypothetical protein